MASHDIWKHPDYRFTMPQGSTKYKEIVIKVIDSVPNSEITKETLSNVLDQVLDELPRNKTIVDFGAGKLRNTEYLLKKGCKVYAVEFEEMQQKSKNARKLYEKMEKYKPNFKPIVFPHDFFNEKIKADLIIAVNVHNVMPVPAERLLLLQYCRMKLKNNGYFLYYGQHDDPDTINKNTPKNKIGDGHYSHSQYKYQTFYHNYNQTELDIMFLANGFRLYKKYCAGSTNHALLYKMVGNNPLEKILNGKKIRKYIAGSEQIIKKTPEIQILKKSKKIMTNFPMVDELTDEILFIDALKNLSAGRQNAYTYENLTSAILLNLFAPNLEQIKINHEINDAHDRPDILLRNHANSGFFNRQQGNSIIFECKNYKCGVGNGIDQISARFNNKIGRFGIICYRKDQNLDKYKNTISHCQTQLDNHANYILCINDNDIIKMLHNKMTGKPVDIVIQDKHDELTDV